jgi:HEPN domain-containing protein
MLPSDVKEWLQIADEDLYSAKILNKQYRKPVEIICYHCAQSAEKYLKGFLAYNGIMPPKIHNLIKLHQMCADIDHGFKILRKECKFLNIYANDIRYPFRIEVTEDNATYAIKFVEKIKALEPIHKLLIEAGIDT